MTNKSTQKDIPSEGFLCAIRDFDDTINLESKVIFALSRLQNSKTASKKHQRANGVSCTRVVQFLKANYSWLDGDIQSQVKTALLSFVKMGIVCILDNSKYRLVVPNTKVLNATCLTRTSHGSKCCCLFTLKCLLNNSTNFCCFLKSNGSRKKTNAAAKKYNKKAPGQTQKRYSGSEFKKTKCLPATKESIGAKKKENSKCLYCLENHSPVKPKKTCETCNPVGGTYSIPIDVFSPRDEVMNTSYFIVQK